MASPTCHEEQREKQAHPLKRIMTIEDEKDGVLEFHYNEEENMLRAHRAR